MSLADMNPEIVRSTVTANAEVAPMATAEGVDLSAKNDRVHLRIIHTNDVYDIDNWPRVKSAIDSLKLEEGPGQRNMLILAGDFLAPSVLSSVDEGQCMVDCMNQLNFDFVTIGNHEADVTLPAFVDRIKESKFPWLNTNMRNFPACVPDMPDVLKYEVTNGNGHSRNVAFLGLLSNDPALYLPNAFWGAQILPVIDTAMEYYEKIKDEVDTVIPITHQFMPADRTLAQVAQGRFPVILGGHDHSPFLEVINECPIVKTGMDAHNVSVIDLVWSDRNEKFPDVSTQMVAVRRFEPEPVMQVMVKENSARLLRKLQEAEIMEMPNELRPLTSKDIRVAQRSMGTFLLSAIRDGMLADCAIVAAGSVRRGMDYPDEHKIFNFCDLVSEMPFQDDMVVIDMPGKVISDTFHFSRSGKKVGTGAFMQMDSGMQYVDGKVTHVAGQPLIDDKMYRVVCSAAALDGVDENIPLLQWRQDTAEGPLSAKPVPQEGSPDRLLQKTAILRWSVRQRIVSNLNGRQSLTREEFDHIYAGQPDWFRQSLFNLVDFDCDGALGCHDIAILNCCVLLAYPNGCEMTQVQLKERLTACIGEKEATEAVAGLLEKRPEENVVITRKDVGDWLLRLHSRQVKV